METITIEVRSRLRSCNIFISTKDILEKNSIQLKLNESLISFRIGNETKYLPLNLVKIIPKTLSSLSVTNNWISLRVQTQPTESTYGSFKTELVGTSNKPEDIPPKSNDIELLLKDKECSIVCSRCKNPVSETISFKRILPLPTNNCDPSEWFCCKHDGDDYATIPDPKESDCFYEKDCQLLNKAIFKKEIKIDQDNNAVTCNRCLSVLGAWSTSTYKNSLKIWNCCIDYRSSNDSHIILKASDPLGDFTLIVIDKTDIFTGNKILIEASDGDLSHYLLVQLMDKNLQLITEKNQSELSGNNDANTIELISNRVTKVLYKYAETEAEITRQCIDTERCEVALPVMLAAMDHLLLTTQRYPPSYRIVDEYYVGYIYL